MECYKLINSEHEFASLLVPARFHRVASQEIQTEKEKC